MNARLANIERDLGKAAHIAEKNSKRMESAFAGAKAAYVGLGASLGKRLHKSRFWGNIGGNSRITNH